MDPILKICKKYNVKVIEDAAEVIGLKYKNRMCGSFGDISTFSFYANKQITTGEGGMISTNKLELYNKCKSLRNLCFGKNQRFNHDDIGWNYRITNIQAVWNKPIKSIRKNRKRKIYIGNYYYKKLSKNNNIYLTPPKITYSENIYCSSILIKNKKVLASKIIKKLNDLGIGARPFFWPMHEQDVFKRKIFSNKKYPNSSYLSRYGFYIPSFPDIKKTEMDYIISKLNLLL